MTSFKESIMIVGGDSVGKTAMLFDIAKAHPDAKIYIFDFENKTAKIHAGFYPEVENVTIKLIKSWADVIKAFDVAEKVLKAGDWLMIDGLGTAWDMIQAEWAEQGPDQWQWIKARHNKDFLDKASAASYHFAATAWAQSNADYNIDRETDREIKDDLLLWKQFGFRPDGEKRNTRRFDTVFALHSRVNPIRQEISTIQGQGAALC